MSGIAYCPPTTYFQNINFNNDFYAIPNNNQGITLAYANTHYLFSIGIATSTAITTYFSGSVGIGTIATTARTLNCLTINAINAIELNGINISTLYQPIINTYTVSGGTGGSMAFSSGILTLTLPTSYSFMTINSLTTATSFMYKGTELSTTLATYQPIINTYTVSGGTGGSMAFLSGILTLTLPTSYLSMTINSLTTATSFVYKGTELSTTLNNYLLLSGGTLTGTLTGTTINATTLQQGGTALNTIITNNLSSYLTATQTSNQFLLLSGGTMTGNLYCSNIYNSNLITSSNINSSNHYISNLIQTSNLYCSYIYNSNLITSSNINSSNHYNSNLIQTSNLYCSNIYYSNLSGGAWAQ